MVVVSGSSVTTPAGTAASTPLIVQVTDQFEFSIPNVPVTFATTGSGTLGATTVTSGTDGRAQTTFTAGTKAGTEIVSASIGGSSTPAQFTVTTAAGAATAVAVVPDNGQSAAAGSALTNPLVVSVVDQYGNPVPRVALDWSGGDAIATPQTATDITGQAQNTVTLPAAPGNDVITVAVHGNAAITPVTFTETAH